MSRNLPARPNLEYLKKEAKDLLDVLQRSDAADRTRSSPTPGRMPCRTGSP